MVWFQNVNLHFVINGIAVHLNGMKHYSRNAIRLWLRIAADQSTTVKGRGVVVLEIKPHVAQPSLPNRINGWIHKNNLHN